jgi:hypothetical protein
MFMSFVILSVNRDYLLNSIPVDLCNGEVLCFLWGTDCIFQYCKSSSNAREASLQRGTIGEPPWTNLILYGINVDTGTRPWEVKVNK